MTIPKKNKLVDYLIRYLNKKVKDLVKLVINQAYLFLIFTLDGLFIGLLFDFFRILRKSFKTINLITYIEDILFWIATGISIIFCMYRFSEGSLRLFMFLGLGFGLTLYMLTFSKIVIKIFVFLIITVKKMIHQIIKMIITPFKWIYHIADKIMFRPIYLLGVKTRTFLIIFFLFSMSKFQKINNKLKNMKNFKKNVKNY